MGQPRFALKPAERFRQPVSRPPKLGPEYNPWFWNPNNVSVRFAPQDFRAKIKDIDPKYEVTWNPITERWQVFAEAPYIQHKVCRGWRLIFVVELDKEFIPLDERTLAKAWDRSVRKHGSPNKYWQRIESEIIRTGEKRDADRLEHSHREGWDYNQHLRRPFVGYGGNNGSKFANWIANT